MHRHHRRARRRRTVRNEGGTRRGKVLRRSADWPFDRYSVIEPAWAGATVVILGGGPSLTREQFDLVAAAHAAGRVRAIAINNSYLAAPWADILYFADTVWWTNHKGRAAFREFKGLKCTIENTGCNVDDEEIHMLRNAGTVPRGDKQVPDGLITGLSLDGRSIRTGQNGGYQALNIAVAAGARRISLCGLDMKFRPGLSHWHGGHDFARQSDDTSYKFWARHFDTIPGELPDGVDIVNASAESMIFTFPKVTLELAREVSA